MKIGQQVFLFIYPLIHHVNVHKLESDYLGSIEIRENGQIEAIPKSLVFETMTEAKKYAIKRLRRDIRNIQDYQDLRFKNN